MLLIAVIARGETKEEKFRVDHDSSSDFKGINSTVNKIHWNRRVWQRQTERGRQIDKENETERETTTPTDEGMNRKNRCTDREEEMDVGRGD